ncbi:DoxX family protein [Guptibacillus hwajinpoensis]|uniref:Membrane protein YphA (DoxX/SURF4 family) n=1 Tax=Guptibacillus hwajinpoensis TaxID=208199 RepID=A0ABU0K3V4_9BACL|nr:DoxX family protein [Alkalihalobacillus hemicentroti]MDQ0484033.1 putative membrane protein YphA (DoxX/SURF4 family) [Alkalihalobacillus hemicentroti]
MNITLWIVQILLALLFLMVGSQKVMPSKKGNEEIDRTGNASNLFTFIGIVEILGAVGLILPWLLNIVPVLTPLAAVGFSIIMVLAAIHHAKRKEMKSVVTNIIILALAIFVVIGRLI